jgi:hypothetical protein
MDAYVIMWHCELLAGGRAMCPVDAVPNTSRRTGNKTFLYCAEVGSRYKEIPDSIAKGILFLCGMMPLGN